MLILWSSLKNLPVASKDGKHGVVRDIIVDPENSVVVAFEIQTGLFRKNKYLAFHDAIGFDKEAVIIASPDNIVDLDEIVRAEKIKKKKIPVLNAKARTESGKSLGKVFDLAINVETGLATKYYLRHLLFLERIIPMQRIIKINQHGIVFEDDVLAIPAAQGVTANG